MELGWCLVVRWYKPVIDFWFNCSSTQSIILMGWPYKSSIVFYGYIYVCIFMMAFYQIKFIIIDIFPANWVTRNLHSSLFKLTEYIFVLSSFCLFIFSSFLLFFFRWAPFWEPDTDVHTRFPAAKKIYENTVTQDFRSAITSIQVNFFFSSPLLSFLPQKISKNDLSIIVSRKVLKLKIKKKKQDMLLLQLRFYLYVNLQFFFFFLHFLKLSLNWYLHQECT